MSDGTECDTAGRIRPLPDPRGLSPSEAMAWMAQETERLSLVARRALAREEMALRALRDIRSGATHCAHCGKLPGDDCLQPFACDWRAQPPQEIAQDALQANEIMRAAEPDEPPERRH